MRKTALIIALVAFVLTVASATSSQPPVEHLSPHCGIVVAVNHAADTVTVEDPAGNLWVFYGAEDWTCGDIAALLMDDCGTPSIYDDKIVSVRYCGTIR